MNSASDSVNATTEVALRPLGDDCQDLKWARQLTGLPGSFVYPLFVKRRDLFHRQEISVKGDIVAELGCSFYERLRSPSDLITAMQLDSALSARGIKVGRKPAQELVVKIFRSMYDAPGGVVPMPDPEERTVGDHAVMPIGIQDERVFFLQHWGPRWGDDGVGSFSIDYLNRYQREAWSIRPQVAGPWPEGVPGLRDLGPSNERWDQLHEHAWDGHGNSKFILLHRGTQIDVLGRWLIGLSDGSAWLQCVAVMRKVEGGPLIVGWIHLRGTASGADVEELYVWPPYREGGIGTALVSQALLYGAMTPWRELPLTWHELEADTVVRQRSPLKPHLPQWFRELPWAAKQSGATATQGTLMELLIRLAGLQILDGVRLLRSEKDSHIMDMVGDDERASTYAVVISTQQRSQI